MDEYLASIELDSYETTSLSYLGIDTYEELASLLVHVRLYGLQSSRSG